ncbi:hypothetical protein Tco_0223605 [Tanacetum coccineum]
MTSTRIDMWVVLEQKRMSAKGVKNVGNNPVFIGKTEERSLWAVPLIWEIKKASFEDARKIEGIKCSPLMVLPRSRAPGNRAMAYYEISCLLMESLERRRLWKGIVFGEDATRAIPNMGFNLVDVEGEFALSTLDVLQSFGFFLQMGFTLILATLDGLDVGLLGDVIGEDDCDEDE